MAIAESKLGRSFVRGGPVGIAVLLGIFLVATSALSYRDARLTAGLVSEREGMRLFLRIGATLARQHQGADSGEALRGVLEANQTLGLTYVGLYDVGAVGPPALIAEAGRALLPARLEPVGSPLIGNGRVRMVNWLPPPPSLGPLHGPPPLWPDGPGAPPGAPPPFLPHLMALPGGGTPFGAPPDGPLPPFPHSRLAIEFEPIASMEAVHRSFAVLLLSIGASLLLTAAAVVAAARAARSDLREAELLGQRHLAQLGTLSAVLAHEIRNPLASLKGHAQLLAERVDDPQLATRVGRVVTEAVRLEQLTADLLEFARSGSIDVAPVNPQAVLERAAQATDPSRIDTDAAQAPAEWPLDADRMHQLLTNLFDNALAVTASPDRVAAAVFCEDGGLVFSVRDRGPGVPAAERAHIFEPFHTTKTRGTGLGLAVAKRIIDMHGGSIDVRDAAGGGAVFRVYLPARTADGDA